MLDIAFAPLALVPKTFNTGDKVRVTVSLVYTAGVSATVKLFAGPYYTNLFGQHMVGACVGQADVPLPAASSPTTLPATVDFVLVEKSLGGIENGTYGLKLWIEGTTISGEQDNVLIVSGNPDSGGGSGNILTSMMPMLMMVMMLGMIMPMMQGMGGGGEE